MYTYIYVRLVFETRREFYFVCFSPFAPRPKTSCALVSSLFVKYFNVLENRFNGNCVRAIRNGKFGGPWKFVRPTAVERSLLFLNAREVAKKSYDSRAGDMRSDANDPTHVDLACKPCSPSRVHCGTDERYPRRVFTTTLGRSTRPPCIAWR